MINPKAKGSTGELEAAALLEGWAKEVGVVLTFKRNLEQVRSGGFDLMAKPCVGIAVEVKRVEALAVNTWWAQAVRQGEHAGLIPVLMYRQNRKPWTFKVRIWTAVHASSTGKTLWLQVDVTMDAASAKNWFQEQVKVHAE